jgi:formylglycine-generating enzyme required for sulfatase activity
MEPTHVAVLTSGTTAHGTVAAAMRTAEATRPAALPTRTETQPQPEPAPKVISEQLPGPAAITLDLGDRLILELVLIKAGTFLMGSPESDKEAGVNEKPQHTVVISKPFYMARYLVTQEQYERVMGKNPSHFTPQRGERGFPPRFGDSESTSRFPVENVSWDEAQEFCARLSAATKRQVELPTEAEWEYGCRAGTTTRFYCGDRLSMNDANIPDNLVGYRPCTSRVGR